jgi:hypothetical protein
LTRLCEGWGERQQVRSVKGGSSELLPGQVSRRPFRGTGVTTAPPADSTLGRLLQELSWEGRSVRNYRDGGLGRENVLTAEVLTALDYLPRTAFLGAVLAAAHGADQARSQVMSEVEEAVITLLPDEVRLQPRNPHQQDGLVVQPDAIISSSNSYVLVEAKRLRRSSFQPEQLAREYLAVTQQANGRTPLLLLILGAPPPVAGRASGDSASRTPSPGSWPRGCPERRNRARRGVTAAPAARGPRLDDLARPATGGPDATRQLLWRGPVRRGNGDATRHLHQRRGHPAFLALTGRSLAASG